MNNWSWCNHSKLTRLNFQTLVDVRLKLATSLMEAPEPSGHFTMSHRELPHRKVHVPHGKKLCSTDHPFDTGSERLLGGESFLVIISQ